MDNYDEEYWTEMDIEDLRAAIEGGATIQEAADLCRAHVLRRSLANARDSAALQRS